MANIHETVAIFARVLEFVVRTAVHRLSVAFASGLGILFLWMLDNNTVTLPFCLSVVAVSASLLFLATRRLAFSVYSAWMLVAALTVVSAIKYRMKGFSLHFFDIVMVAEDADIVKFLLSSYLHLVAPVLVLSAICLVAGVALFRYEKPGRTSLLSRGASAMSAALLIPLTFPAEAAVEQRYFYYMYGRHASAFFVSLLDLKFAFAENDLEARLAAKPASAPFSGAPDCGAGSRPDIMVVLEESMADPAVFPQIADGPAISRTMAGSEGAMHPLNVETFGGGTWITNLSLMSGLSATDFGWRSPYLTMMLEGRVKGALPEILAHCGYRTAAVLPLNYTFVNEGPFLSSIGFEIVLDKDAIGAGFYHLRDDFYFDAASRFIDEHRRTDGRPLFLLVQTMFAHSPYEERLEPEESVAGEPLSPDRDVAEYLRRMVIARADFAAFAERQRAAAADRGLVIASFGDHQSFATSAYASELAGETALAEPGSIAYRTFFTISDGDGPAALPGLPSDGPLDIAYLGTAILDAAGIPGNDVFADLRELAAHCSGRFFACPDRGRVDDHLRRRMAGGLLNIGPQPGS